MDKLKDKILKGTSRSLESFGIDKLKEITLKSDKEKREYGFVFCSDTDIPPFGNISHSDLCKGEECHLEINDCKNKKKIGTFHTHPHVERGITIENLSDKDIYDSISHRESFSCIGVIKNKPIIKCFTPILDIDPSVVSEVLNTQDDVDRKISEFKNLLQEQKQDKIEKGADELVKSHEAMKKADNRLHRASELLYKKLLSKEADLTIE